MFEYDQPLALKGAGLGYTELTAHIMDNGIINQEKRPQARKEKG